MELVHLISEFGGLRQAGVRGVLIVVCVAWMRESEASDHLRMRISFCLQYQFLNRRESVGMFIDFCNAHSWAHFFLYRMCALGVCVLAALYFCGSVVCTILVERW